MSKEVIGYVIYTEIEKLLIVSKMVYLHKKGVAQTCSRLPFSVGYYVCFGPTGDANVTFPAIF